MSVLKNVMKNAQVRPEFRCSDSNSVIPQFSSKNIQTPCTNSIDNYQALTKRVDGNQVLSCLDIVVQYQQYSLQNEVMRNSPENNFIFTCIIFKEPPTQNNIIYITLVEGMGDAQNGHVQIIIWVVVIICLLVKLSVII